MQLPCDRGRDLLRRSSMILTKPSFRSKFKNCEIAAGRRRARVGMIVASAALCVLIIAGLASAATDQPSPAGVGQSTASPRAVVEPTPGPLLAPPLQTRFTGFFFSMLVLFFLLILPAITFWLFVRTFAVDLKSGAPDEDAKKKISKMISFCYVLMLLSLTIAVSPLVLFMTLPQSLVGALYAYMFESPVAFVLGCVHDVKPEDTHWEAVCQPSDPYANEWLINIGGYVLVEGGPTVVAVPPAPSNVPAGGANPAGNSSSTGAADSPGAQASSTVAGAVSVPPWPDINLIGLRWFFPRAVIHGGLTVPFYFILISVIGGAISLARKVPEYQAQFLDEKHSAAEMRQHLVFQVLQVLSAPSLAIAAYVLITPSSPATSIPLAFAAGFSSEPVLKFITSAVQKFDGSSRPGSSSSRSKESHTEASSSQGIKT